VIADVWSSFLFPGAHGRGSVTAIFRIKLSSCELTALHAMADASLWHVGLLC